MSVSHYACKCEGDKDTLRAKYFGDIVNVTICPELKLKYEDLGVFEFLEKTK